MFPTLLTQYVVVDPGVTETQLVDPLIELLPTLLPVPHSYVAPSPSLPPAAVNVVDAPLHIVVVPVIEVGAVGAVCITTASV